MNVCGNLPHNTDFFNLFLCLEHIICASTHTERAVSSTLWAGVTDSISCGMCRWEMVEDHPVKFYLLLAVETGTFQSKTELGGCGWGWLLFVFSWFCWGFFGCFLEVGGFLFGWVLFVCFSECPILFLLDN